MHYQISRNGQMYGPYTLEDLQRYLASGNVLPTDLAKNEEMAEWVPVSQLLAPPPPTELPPSSYTAPEFPTQGFSSPGYADPAGTGYQPVGQAYAAGYAAPNAGLATSTYPDAPNLNWGLYLLFSIITCGLFSKVFTCIQAGWLKRVQPNSTGLIFYAVAYVLWLVNQIRSWGQSAAIFAAISQHHVLNGSSARGGSGLFLLYWILLFVTRFVMRNSLQEHFNTVEPIGLRLNPVMTFFFGGVYFQSELNRINDMKQAARLGAGRTF